ncbi:unnamed protein product [Microthlaspi erraticum]|uniref:Uncharacterized protein n=1 Tax=Microthlaspi erraticum TaxID=1685480 RepID=A0A6D2I7R4_9BRAS|nr:unnamed protein product [Microthlaspi erraticum]CAA7056109.1 unnamed protein product [Microthlaspi erraticum]
MPEAKSNDFVFFKIKKRCVSLSNPTTHQSVYHSSGTTSGSSSSKFPTFPPIPTLHPTTPGKSPARKHVSSPRSARTVVSPVKSPGVAPASFPVYSPTIASPLKSPAFAPATSPACILQDHCVSVEIPCVLLPHCISFEVPCFFSRHFSGENPGVPSDYYSSEVSFLRSDDEPHCFHKTARNCSSEPATGLTRFTTS